MSGRFLNKIDTLTDGELYEELSPKIFFYSNKQVCIEGCKGIIEYNICSVRLNCKRFIVAIEGSELSIRSHNADELIVCGEITKLNFCSC